MSTVALIGIDLGKPRTTSLICEAASRPTMRFVTPKTEVQQTLSVAVC